ncbi:MAG: glucosyltransferase domain-containing protein [Acetobacter sp.]
MQIIQDVDGFFNTKNQNHRYYFLFLFLALIAVLPNAMLFSTDEIAIYMDEVHGPLVSLGIDQGFDGRYSFAAICWILSAIHMDYQSFLVFSIISYAFGLATIYFTLFRTTGQDINSNTLLGFGAFLTFGLLLDQMQFSIQSLQYAACMFAVSAIAILATSSRRPFTILAIGSVIFTLGIGFYQNILQISAYFILASIVLQSSSGRAWKPIAAQASLMAGCTILGSIPYPIINTTLKHMGSSWFHDYPSRALGLSYALKNLPEYLLTIPRAFGIIGYRYITLLPHIIALLILAVIGLYFVCCWKQGLRQRLVSIALVITALLILPNPANLLLAGFWPTSRTLCAFGLFVAALIPIICRSQTGTWLAIIFVAMQSGVAVKNYAQRLDQLIADTAIAENLLLEAYRNTPVGTQPKITLGVSGRSLNLAVPQPYAYGISMFNDYWSAATFVRYISGKKVNVILDDGTVCTAQTRSLTITPTKDGINACFAPD